MTGPSAQHPTSMKISPLRFLCDDHTGYRTTEILNTPELILGYWKTHLRTDFTLELRKEHLIVILLNTRLKAIGHTIVSIGTNNQTLAHPPEILRPVLLGGTENFVLVHNHPSGNPDPSIADTNMTRKLKEACDLLELRFIDHVIIGDCGTKDPSYYSYTESGKL